MKQAECKEEHEFIKVKLTASNYDGVVSSWWQCKNCGKIKDNSVTYKSLK